MILCAFTASGQNNLPDTTDEVTLIQPFIDMPSMNKRQADSFIKNQSFRNWGIERLNLSEVMQDYTGKGIKICIADTGRPKHTELQQAIKGSANFSNVEGVDDLQGHSTHVAGIVNEIVPDAELYFAKVLNDSGSGTNAGVTQGIQWCVDQGSNIVNLSLSGSQPFAEMKTVIDEAIQKGVIIIAAAGNRGQNPDIDLIGYPAKFDEVICVGSINDMIEVSRFSSSGKNGDIVGPGEQILSTYKDNRFAVLSGTSMSAPFISGVCALWIEKNQIQTNLEPLLERLATDITPEGFDIYSFHGHVEPDSLFRTIDNPDEPDDPIDPDPELPDDDENPSVIDWISQRWIFLLGGLLSIGVILYMMLNRK